MGRPCKFYLSENKVWLTVAVPPKYITMKRTLAIGDIHGGLKALKQVLQKALVSENDRLIFVGDYVDGWSESAQVIEFIINLSKEQNCLFIKGNHDVWCENWLRSGIADANWLLHGGKATIESYTNLDAAAKAGHLNFLEKMELYHVDANNRLFIHAGFTAENGPQAEMQSSTLTRDRTLWEMAVKMDKRSQKNSAVFPKRLKLFDEIFIGHTPTIYYNITVPMQACNVWNVDTGAAFTGRLSIMDISTKQFWQSDELPGLYPGEIGRNKD